jgi:autotransporter-like protein
MFRFYTSILIFLILLLPKVSYATFNNISGTYTGNITGTDFNGSPGPCPTHNQSFSGTLTLTLIGDDQGNITGGSGQYIDNTSGEVGVISAVSGANNDTTILALGFIVDGIDTGTLTGTFNANSITISGGIVASDCNTTISNSTLLKSGGSTTVVGASTPSSTVTDAVLFNSLIQNTVFGISGHVSRAMSGFISSFSPRFGENNFEVGGMTGLNAGDGQGIPYGIWGNYSYTDFENDFSATAIDGVSHGFLGGIDFRVGESTILGIALGYDNSDIDTGFNGGNQITDTVTIAPYFGSILNDTLSVDFSIGYSNVGYDQFRTDGTTRITSSPVADRWFGALNLNAIKFVDNWIISGRVGSVYASSTIHSYTESNSLVVAESHTRLSSISIGSEIAYSLKEWEPFLNLAYQYDYQLKKVATASGPQPANDTDDILLSTGVRYFEKSGITGNLEYSKRLLREDFSEDRLSLTVRIDY